MKCFCFVSLLIGAPSGSLAGNIYTFTTFDVPGAAFTEANGINDAGQIVGSFTDPMNELHGILATPIPEPTTWLENDEYSNPSTTE
jgi:hypothetical protein